MMDKKCSCGCSMSACGASCAGGCGSKLGCTGSMIAKIILLIGGLNWGLVGIGGLLGKNYNLVNLAFGSMPKVEFAIYIIVGLAAIIKCIGCGCRKCRMCKDGVCGMSEAKNTDMPKM